MKLSVLHSTLRVGRITSLTPTEAQENFCKQIGRPPTKDLPKAANVINTKYCDSSYDRTRNHSRNIVHLQCTNSNVHYNSLL
ncbi:MAG TPA: hypothetical protein DCE56_36850 [Cyanobacteria bacterium UBA8553]|nr:hypothetical protein [Cyanobacteria bacterium UBA8553]